MTDEARRKKNKEYRRTYYQENERSTNELFSDEEKKGQKWTVAEQQFLIENTEKSYLELSKILGRTCMSIRNKKQRLGLLRATQ